MAAVQRWRKKGLMRGGREVKRVSDQGCLVRHHIFKGIWEPLESFQLNGAVMGLVCGGEVGMCVSLPIFKKEIITLWRRNHSSYWSHVVQVRINQILNWNDGFGNGWEIVFSGESERTYMYWRGKTMEGFSGGPDGKESACNAGDPGSVPGSERSPGDGNGYALQHSCLENPMDGGAWRAAVHGVTQLSN